MKPGALPAVFLGALAVLLATAAGAGAAEQTVRAGEGVVAATLSYEGAQPLSGGEPAKDLRLTIERRGSKVYEEPVSTPHCGPPCGLERFGGGPLTVRDLEGRGEPDVIVELYTGGAHCCTIAQVFAYDPGTMTYSRAEHDFADAGARLTSVSGDGKIEFETADDRFAYEFAPFAYSGLPLQILGFRGGRFRDVTRSFPEALRKDAARWLKAFRSERRLQLGNGPIAAWAADEELLGSDRLVRTTLAREAAAGRLRSREGYGPSGNSFVRALLRFLRRTGYR